MIPIVEFISLFLSKTVKSENWSNYSLIMELFLLLRWLGKIYLTRKQKDHKLHIHIHIHNIQILTIINSILTSWCSSCSSIVSKTPLENFLTWVGDVIFINRDFSEVFSKEIILWQHIFFFFFFLQHGKKSSQLVSYYTDS